MKTFAVIFAVLAYIGVSVDSKLQCNEVGYDGPTSWADMTRDCTRKMRDQVQTELGASITYLAMAAHFSKDTVNRPGFAELFFKSASEEREHAMKIISYLLMRGELTDDVSSLITMPMVNQTVWNDGLHALKDALELEAKVTKSIRDIIQVCEEGRKGSHEFNDYHLSDYLTGDFLEEQYNGQRDLAGKVSTLGKMKQSHGDKLGEFLFDKKLLE